MNKRMPLSAILLASVLLGAGCNQTPAPTPSPSDTSSDRPAAVQGFGMLPPVLGYGSLGTEAARSFRPADAALSSIAPVPMMAGVAMTEPAIAVRAPTLPEEAKVVYDIKGELPTWSADGTVYRVRQPGVSTSVARSIADAAGVPSQVSGGATEIQGANVSWRDAAGFIWNVDLPGRNLNWWKNVDYSKTQPEANNNPKLDAAAVKTAADNFLRDHGFGNLVGKGIIEETPMIMPLLRGESAPCPLMAEAREAAANPVAPEADKIVDSKMMIWPSPCGYPIQVTVYYPDVRDNMSTVDAGGWASRKASIQIDISNNSIVGGNVMLPSNEDSSAYPLISSEEAMKRLMAGGNNPIYGWYDGSGVKEVRATISTVKLGWMRHDSWENNAMKTYFLPALLAEGTIDRGNSNQTEPEKYYTVVPLVADAAFQTNNTPIMYMRGVADPAATDMAPTPAVAPPAVPIKQ
jgi:hypothetical protein